MCILLFRIRANLSSKKPASNNTPSTQLGEQQKKNKCSDDEKDSDGEAAGTKENDMNDTIDETEAESPPEVYFEYFV